MIEMCLQVDSRLQCGSQGHRHRRCSKPLCGCHAEVSGNRQHIHAWHVVQSQHEVHMLFLPCDFQSYTCQSYLALRMGGIFPATPRACQILT